MDTCVYHLLHITLICVPLTAYYTHLCTTYCILHSLVYHLLHITLTCVPLTAYYISWGVITSTVHTYLEGAYTVHIMKYIASVFIIYFFSNVWKIGYKQV